MWVPGGILALSRMKKWRFMGTPVEAEATGWGEGDEHVQGEWVSCIERADGRITNTEGVGRLEAEEPGKDQWER